MSKLKMFFVALAFILMLAVNTRPAYASDISAAEGLGTTKETESEAPIYRVTIVFKSNGGTGSMDKLVVTSDAMVKLPSNQFERTGYQFAGWNTVKKGGGTAYTDEQDVAGLATAANNGSKIVLYAQWKKSKVTITFNSNGGMGSMGDLVVTSGVSAKLPSNQFEKTGYRFTGWNTVKTGSCTAYTDGQDVTGLATADNDGSKIVLYAQWKMCKVTIVFKKNGGKGSMNKLVVSGNASAKLPANKFKRTGYSFNGWNTTKNGSGTAYTNKQKVTGLATADNDGSKIILYAQWKKKLKKPAIKSAVSENPSYIMVAFKKYKSVSGYEIEYSTNKKFKKNVKIVMAAKNATSAKLMEVTPDKTYYIRMRSYYVGGSVTSYSKWSKVVSAKVQSGSTIANTSCVRAIEADLKLNGSGSGYHAKLVTGNATSAVSFGIQYDQGAAEPYGCRAMALIENVSSNNTGGQAYERPGDLELQLNTTYHLMLTVDASGNGKVFVDYVQVGSFYQPNLGSNDYLAVEVSARLNGDTVDAEFSNIKIKNTAGIKVLESGGNMKYSLQCRNTGLNCSYDEKNGLIRLYGTICDINGDWDSDFAKVSYVVTFS